MRWSNFLLGGLLLLAILVVPDRLLAQQQQGSGANNANFFTIKTYEVGDLVIDVPNYGLAGDNEVGTQYRGGGLGGGGGFGGAGGVAAGEMGASGGGYGQAGAGSTYKPRQITMDDLRDVIVSVVAPDSWAQSGGELGRIELLGTALVISQTPGAHEAIAGLLDDLRQGSATRRTVTVDARWLLLDSNDLDRLIPNNDKEPQVDRKLLEEFTRRPASLRSITKCFSGQSVYLISGTRRNIVSSYIPVVGSIDPPQADRLYALGGNAEIVFTQFGGQSGPERGGGNRNVGYQPVIERPNFGVTLEVRPTLLARGNEAVIDLKSTVTFPAPQPQQAPPDNLSGMPPVDRLAIQTQEIATTLRIPLGEPTLVGGMTYLATAVFGPDGQPALSSPRPAPTPNDEGRPSPEAPPEARANEQRQLYLVIELR